MSTLYLHLLLDLPSTCMVINGNTCFGIQLSGILYIHISTPYQLVCSYIVRCMMTYTFIFLSFLLDSPIDCLQILIWAPSKIFSSICHTPLDNIHKLISYVLRWSWIYFDPTVFQLFYNVIYLWTLHYSFLNPLIQCSTLRIKRECLLSRYTYWYIYKNT